MQWWLVLACAVAVVATPEVCSKRGHLYPDSPKCECYPCFGGDSCEQQIEGCSIDATQGNPSVYQEYWDANPTQYAVTISTNYRTGYQDLKDFNDPIAPATSATLEDSQCLGIQCSLRDAINALHAMAGNAKASDKWIVFGGGASQLIAAATVAAVKLRERPVSVYARPPRFGGYEEFANYGFANASFFDGDPAPLASSAAAADVIEFIAYPNNPDGLLYKPAFEHTEARIAYDMVYYWPSLFTVEQEMDCDIMFFSLSKLTGHGGSRFGWALVRDEDFAMEMSNFVDNVQIHISIDAQFRALRLITHLVDTQGAMFTFIKDTMAYRWSMLAQLFAAQSAPARFALRSVTGTFYAWIECLHDTDVDCNAVFEQALVLGIEGAHFGVSNKFVRLELVQYTAVYELLLLRLRQLMLGESSNTSNPAHPANSLSQQAPAHAPHPRARSLRHRRRTKSYALLDLGEHTHAHAHVYAHNPQAQPHAQQPLTP